MAPLVVGRGGCGEDSGDASHAVHVASRGSVLGVDGGEAGSCGNLKPRVATGNTSEETCSHFCKCVH